MTGGKIFIDPPVTEPTRTVAVVFTETEFAQLAVNAMAVQLSIEEYFRSVALKASEASSP